MYSVYDKDKKLVMQSEDNSRYDKETESELLKAGYMIFIDGKKIKQMIDKLKYLNNIKVFTFQDLIKSYLLLKSRKPNIKKFNLFGYQIDWVEDKQYFKILSNTKQALNMYTDTDILIVFNDKRLAILGADAFKEIYRWTGKEFILRERFIKNHSYAKRVYDDIMNVSLKHDWINVSAVYLKN